MNEKLPLKTIKVCSHLKTNDCDETDTFLHLPLQPLNCLISYLLLKKSGFYLSFGANLYFCLSKI